DVLDILDVTEREGVQETQQTIFVQIIGIAPEAIGILISGIFLYRWIARCFDIVNGHGNRFGFAERHRFGRRAEPQASDAKSPALDKAIDRAGMKLAQTDFSI